MGTGRQPMLAGWRGQEEGGSRAAAGFASCRICTVQIHAGPVVREPASVGGMAGSHLCDRQPSWLAQQLLQGDQRKADIPGTDQGVEHGFHSITSFQRLRPRELTTPVVPSRPPSGPHAGSRGERERRRVHFQPESCDAGANLVSPLFDARAAARFGRRCDGTPFVPISPSRRGAQRRARAVPLGTGTGPARSHAQPPLGGEHGEHGEDPPLARSEHRGTPADRACESYPQRKSSSSLKFRFRASQAVDFAI